MSYTSVAYIDLAYKEAMYSCSLAIILDWVVLCESAAGGTGNDMYYFIQCIKVPKTNINSHHTMYND